MLFILPSNIKWNGGIVRCERDSNCGQCQKMRSARCGLKSAEYKVGEWMKYHTGLKACIWGQFGQLRERERCARGEGYNMQTFWQPAQLTNEMPKKTPRKVLAMATASGDVENFCGRANFWASMELLPNRLQAIFTRVACLWSCVFWPSSACLAACCCCCCCVVFLACVFHLFFLPSLFLSFFFYVFGQ